MEIRVDARIEQPVGMVFETYRDRMTELTPYLPNILSIEVSERKEREDGVVELVNEWVGGGDIPAAIRGLLDASMLRWTDYASWHPDEHRCAWRNVVHAFPEAIQASGDNLFVAQDGGCLVQIRGELTCDGSKLPMVPRLLRNKVAGTVERVLVSKIGPNLAQVAQGVGKLLDDVKA